MRRKGRFYYHVCCAGGREVWTPLGEEYVQAILKWRQIEGLCEGAATVAQMLDNALAAMLAKLKPGTIKEFTRAASNLKPAFAGFAPADVQTVHLRQYLERRSAKVSANREVAFFSAAWEHARGVGWINLPNPAAGIEYNRERRRKRVATPEEVRALLFDGGKPRDCVEADAVQLALMTAIRQSDLLHMTKRQVERDGLRVKPRKTEHSTEAELLFPWTPELRLCVNRLTGRRRRVGSIYLIAVQRGKRSGQPYSAPSWHKVWRGYFAACGVSGLTWHDLRRTALNARKDEGGTEAAKQMAAHSSLTTTEGYLRQAGAVTVAPLEVSRLIRE